MTATSQIELTRSELIDMRIKCDDDLLFFTRFFYKELRGTKFIVNEHHRTICNELERIGNYLLEFLNINIPPRMSKTELVLNFIARGIGQNPAANYLYITASDELRAEVSVRIRDIVSHRYFKTMYGTELKQDQNGKNLWRTVQGGGLKTATIFGQITGFGAGQMIDHTNKDPDQDLIDYLRTFEGCIAMDDINKMDDAETGNAKNDKVTRVISNTVFSRKNSEDTPMINIQQRAGMDDATAFFMDYYKNNDKAEFLIMPVISEDRVPLWPWKYGLEKIEEMRTSSATAHVFETQYMQNPLPLEGLIYDLNYYDELTNEEHSTSLGFADIADSGTDHLSSPFVKIIGNKVFVHDAIYTQEGSQTSSQKVADRVALYGCVKYYAETNNQGSTYISLLQSKGTVGVHGILSRGNKMGRILSTAWIVNKVFYFKRTGSPEYMKFLKSLETFLKTAKDKDDAPDSISMAAQYIFDKHPYMLRD